MIASKASSFFPRIVIPCSDTNCNSVDDSNMDGNFRLLMQRIIRPNNNNNNSKHFFLSGSLLARSYKYAADLLVMTSNDDDHDIDTAKYNSNNGIKTKNKRNQHDDAESVIGRTIEYRTQAAALSTAVVSALKTPSPFTTPSPTVLCLPSKMKHTPLTAYGWEDTEDEENNNIVPAKEPNKKKRRRRRQQQRQHKRVKRRLFVDDDGQKEKNDDDVHNNTEIAALPLLNPGASSSFNKFSNQQSRHHDDYIDLSSICVNLFK